MNTSYDLLPDFASLETLFILESPHSTEIGNFVAVAGQSGYRMTTKLLDNEETPFGNLLFQKDQRVLQYGVMNTFPFPLGKPSLLKGVQLKMSGLKSICQDVSRKECYKKIRNELKSVKNLESTINFQERLRYYVNKCPKLKRIVVCGYIAHGVFLHYTKGGEVDLRKQYKCNIAGRDIEIYFVLHPSPKTGFDTWDFNLRIFD